MIEYAKGNSLFHKLDPRTKLFWLIATSLLCIISTNFYYLLAILIWVVLTIVALKLPFMRILSFTKVFMFLAIIVIVLQGFLFPGKEILFSILSLTFTTEGFFFGIAIAIRLLCLGFAVPVFVMTTKPKDLIESLGNHVSGEIAFMITTAFRFIPIFQRELQTIINAQQSRALKKRNMKWYFAITIPLLIKALTRAKYMAFSIESRGFSPQLKTNKYSNSKLNKIDWIVIIFIIVFALGLMFFR